VGFSLAAFSLFCRAMRIRDQHTEGIAHERLAT
jgi:hypothetical protein